MNLVKFNAQMKQVNSVLYLGCCNLNILKSILVLTGSNILYLDNFSSSSWMGAG